MDVFELRHRLIEDYRQYVESYIRIKDPRIAAKVADELEAGLLWPDPLLQLNPTFEPGGWIDDLVARGMLHQECGSVFRLGKGEKGRGTGLRLHRHQVDAIEAARSGDNYVLTTDTGSGRSLAYIVPVVDHVSSLEANRALG